MLSTLLPVLSKTSRCTLFKKDCTKISRQIHASSVLCKTGATQEIECEIVPARNLEANQILNMLRRTFFQDEPLIKAVGLSGQTNNDLENYCMDCVDEDLSYVALPKRGVAPLSVCLNSTFVAKDIGHLEKLANHCPCKKTQRLLRFWSYLDRESELWHQYGVSRIFEIRILATDERYRGLGLATALVSESLNLAKKLGFPLVRMDCTNHYSSLAARKLGMELAYSVKYSDYLTNNGRPIFDIPPPHQSATIYVQNNNSTVGRR